MPAFPIRGACGPVAIAALACAAWITPNVLAQEYPSRTIRLISPSAPGGITDVMARLIGERIAGPLKVPVIVENKPGGTGAVALDFVAKSPPDGHTLVLGFAGANVIYPHLNDKLPFNALRDFTPIAQISSGGNQLVVHPSVPVNNVREFIAYVKAQPKPPPYGSWGPGSGGHVAGEYLKILTGIQMFHVPYKNTTALATEVVGGHMPLAMLDTFNAIAQSRAGKLKVIAQVGPTRSPQLANVPTLLEEGIDFGVGAWIGFFGPANLPRPIAQRLHAEIERALRTPDMNERWQTISGYPPALANPEEFAKIILRDWEIWKRVITEGKIKAE
jgi:tripartite-type tricarboxylate transporter receptor subunit TctC